MVEAHMHCRVAAADDAEGISRMLEEAALGIPLLVDTQERRDAFSKIVVSCIASGESWTANDSGGTIAGFILVEPDKMERFQRANDALHLRYACVAKSFRRQGVFRALIERVMERNVPLTATVKAGNQSQMPALLTHMGFQKWSSDPPHDEHFRWQPN